jgi:hypothetical protein
MERACNMCGRDEMCVQNLVGKPDGRIPLRRLGIDRRIDLEWILRKW